MNISTKHKAYFALFITSTVWGTSWIASKIAVKYTPALEVSAIRQGIAGLIFVLFFLVKGEKLPSRKQFIWLAGMSVLLFVSANGFATIGLQYISSGLGALISALYPLSVVIIERIFYKNTRINTQTFIGIFLGLGGIGLVFYENAFHHHAEGYIIGIIFSVIAMLSWAIGTIYIARTKMKINPYYATGWEMICASVILFMMSVATGKYIPISAIPYQTWLSIGYLVSMGSVITFVAFIYTMKHLQPSIAALYAYINPIVAILIGSVFINDPLTINIILGSIITLIGVFIVNQSLKKQRDLASKITD
ncbi:MAG: EamA family transporter [Chitinophagaceae bacterium]|nr:EamA family transporter [Chitinophagaceae bacterium]